MWACVQLGAREHYAIPRGLRAVGALRGLVTDAWSPGQGRGNLPFRRLGERYHTELSDAEVVSGGAGWLVRDAALRTRHALQGSSDWELFHARNRIFDRFASRVIRRWTASGTERKPRTVFAYSYASTATLRVARDTGSMTILGQIDGGPAEEEIVLQETALYPHLRGRDRPAPEKYWKDWREQCEIASRVLVNSAWARECMVRSGVPERKIVELALFYEPRHHMLRPNRAVIPAFSAERPLRLLFLGQFVLRKGAARLLEATRILEGDPVEFRVVGPSGIVIPDEAMRRRTFRYLGPVSRSETARHYAEADVFILPTLSDGYAITQLEAQAFGLPIIASRRCGAVVRHGVNGLLLDEVSGESIAAAVRELLAQPERVAALGSGAVFPFASIQDYGNTLMRLAHESMSKSRQ